MNVDLTQPWILIFMGMTVCGFDTNEKGDQLPFASLVDVIPAFAGMTKERQE